MPSYPIVSAQDGLRLTVNQMAKAPTTIPRLVIQKMDQQFLTDAVLRKGSPAPSGVVLFWESTPLFANTSVAIIEEFGEIPSIGGSLGTPRSVRTVKRGGAVKVSWEMRNRNDLDGLNTQIEQVRNTMVQAWEDAFLAALIGNANVLTTNASTTWDSVSSTMRKDINAARFAVKNAAADAAGTNKFGFVPDTLLISTETETDFLNSAEIQTVFQGNLADESLKYTGKLPSKFMGLDVLVSWRLDNYLPNGAILLQRKRVGGISDERPLQATPLYSERGESGMGGATETYRTDVTRSSAVFIDQPKAACLITGVHT